MLSLWSVLGNPSQIRLLLSSIKGCHLESQGSKHKLDCWWQRLGFHGILRGKLVSHLHPTSLNMRRAANCSPFRFPRADCWASVKCCVTDFSLKVLYTNSRETHAHSYTHKQIQTIWQTATNHVIARLCDFCILQTSRMLLFFFLEFLNCCRGYKRFSTSNCL